MASGEDRPGGLGFGAGVLAGLLFSAVAIVTLSLSVPMAPIETGEPPASTEDEQGGQPAMTDPVATAPVSPAPAPAPATDSTVDDAEEEAATDAAETAASRPPSGPADEPADPPATTEPMPTDTAEADAADPTPDTMEPPTPDTETAAVLPPASPAEATASSAPAEATASSAPAEATAPATPVQGPPAEEEAAAQVAEPAEPEPFADVALETQVEDTAPEVIETPAETETASETAVVANGAPEAPPAAPEETILETIEPAWRLYAAPTPTETDAPLMSVVVMNATAATLPALRTLAPLGGISVAIAADEPDPAGLAEALASLGHEALIVVDGEPMIVPGTVGLALAQAPNEAAAAEALSVADTAGALVFDTAGGGASRLLAAGRAAEQPIAAATLRIDAERTASVAFQTLRDAGALAVRDGGMVVTLEASPTTITALGRWLALPGAVQPAPLTALIEQRGPTRY